MTALAKEVDRIEMELRIIEPGLKHLDLEADRRPLIPKSLIGASLRDSQSEVGSPIHTVPSIVTVAFFPPIILAISFA